MFAYSMVWSCNSKFSSIFICKIKRFYESNMHGRTLFKYDLWRLLLLVCLWIWKAFLLNFCYEFPLPCTIRIWNCNSFIGSSVTYFMLLDSCRSLQIGLRKYLVTSVERSLCIQMTMSTDLNLLTTLFPR